MSLKEVCDEDRTLFPQVSQIYFKQNQCCDFLNVVRNWHAWICVSTMFVSRGCILYNSSHTSTDANFVVLGKNGIQMYFFLVTAIFVPISRPVPGWCSDDHTEWPLLLCSPAWRDNRRYMWSAGGWWHCSLRKTALCYQPWGPRDKRGILPPEPQVFTAQRQVLLQPWESITRMWGTSTAKSLLRE